MADFGGWYHNGLETRRFSDAHLHAQGRVPQTQTYPLSTYDSSPQSLLGRSYFGQNAENLGGHKLIWLEIRSGLGSVTEGSK
jgi:hypothetical protein